MFYNGFTLLMQILAGGTMYYIGRRMGYRQGENDMYKLCKSAQKAADEYFGRVSRSK